MPEKKKQSMKNHIIMSIPWRSNKLTNQLNNKDSVKDIDDEIHKVEQTNTSTWGK